MAVRLDNFEPGNLFSLEVPCYTFYDMHGLPVYLPGKMLLLFLNREVISDPLERFSFFCLSEGKKVHTTVRTFHAEGFEEVILPMMIVQELQSE